MPIASVNLAEVAPAVVTKAFLRAGKYLGINNATLAQIVGVSASTVSRMPETPIKVNHKDGELALLFLRVYRSLAALLGGNAEQCRAWFHAYNRDLGGIPAQLVLTPSGLTDVANYLDAMRGRG